MIFRCVMVSLLVAFCAGPIAADSAIPGTRVFELPSVEGAPLPGNPIVRNRDYVFVRVYSVYSYHEDRDISWATLASHIALYSGEETIEGIRVHKTFDSHSDRGEPVAVNDHILRGCPSTFEGLKLTVFLSGVSDDSSTKRIFDALGKTASIQTVFNMSDAAKAVLSAVTALAEPFFQPRYTPALPAAIADAEASYTLCTADDDLREGALREGYIVVLGSRVSEDRLEPVPALVPENWRVRGGELQYRAPDGEWRSPKRYSYVVLSVSRSLRRDVDPKSPWNDKYRDAVEKVRTGVREASGALVRPTLKDYATLRLDVNDLMIEARALLRADKRYLITEIESIDSSYYDDVDKLLAKFKALCEAQMGDPWALKSEHYLKPMSEDYKSLAEEYERVPVEDMGAILLLARDPGGSPIAQATVSVKQLNRQDGMKTVSTDESGSALVEGLLPAAYHISCGQSETTVLLDPKERRVVELEAQVQE